MNHIRNNIQTFDLCRSYTERGLMNNSKLCTVGSAKTVIESGYDDYRKARVEKLRELYEKYTPKTKKHWVLPNGETDGRKSTVVEEIIGEDISPFDLPDYEEQMPDWEDFMDKYRGE